MKWYQYFFFLFPPALIPYYRRKAMLLVREAEKKAIELQKGNFRVQQNHETEFCFEAGGKKYFKFVNEMNIPAMRAMAALDIYTEVEQKTEKSYHLIAYNAILEAAKKGDLVAVGSMANFALQRLAHITNIDILYKLASVLYFDELENPYEYDPEYAEKKINIWKKESVEGFFLSTPLKDYIPSFGSSNMNLATYTVLQRKELISQLKTHLSVLSASGSNKDLIASTSLEVEKLERLLASEVLQ